jgi:RNA polymerase sigma factor (sigma-70 family)
MISEVKQNDIRPMTDAERDAMALHMNVAYKFMPRKKYDEDQMQDTLLRNVRNWIRNRHKCPQIKDVTFMANSTMYNAGRSKRRNISTIHIDLCVSLDRDLVKGAPYDVADYREPEDKGFRDWSYVTNFLNVLTQRQRDILEMRRRGESLSCIAETFSLSKERIRQIETRAIERLQVEINKDMSKCN